MYGAAHSALFQGLNDTDRLIVSWDLTGAPRPRRASATDADAPLVGPEPVDNPALDGLTHVRIAIPLDIGAVLRADAPAAAAWRTRTRPAFQWTLAHGFRVESLLRDEATQHAYYLLSRT